MSNKRQVSSWEFFKQLSEEIRAYGHGKNDKRKVSDLVTLEESTQKLSVFGIEQRVSSTFFEEVSSAVEAGEEFVEALGKWVAHIHLGLWNFRVRLWIVFVALMYLKEDQE